MMTNYVPASIVEQLTQHAFGAIAKQMEFEVLQALKSVSNHYWTSEEMSAKCHVVHVGGGWVSLICDGRLLLDVGPVTSSMSDGKLVFERGFTRHYESSQAVDPAK